MDGTKTAFKIKAWPTPQDYNEAVQNPAVTIADEELRQASVALDAIGIPRPITGGFATVYRFQSAAMDWAVRCFLHHSDDQAQRYAVISRFVHNDDLPYTVDFDFIPTGIKIGAQWYPVLKMEWVEGVTLERYIAEHLDQPDLLNVLADKFLAMCDALRSAGIAHGDLQHGNILVCDGELRLVDYDGMYVPEMTGFKASEIGHRNYQHPGRSAEHFDSSLDNFSAWVIYASIKAFSHDGSLWRQLHCGDDCLLFRQSDFARPERSPAFAALERSGNDQLKQLSRFIRAQLEMPSRMVPALAEQVPACDIELAPIDPHLPVTREEFAGAPTMESSANLPAWMLDNWKAHCPQTHGTARQHGPVHPHLSPAIPPELLRPRPRRVTFNHDCGEVPPLFWQIMQIFNPAFYMTFAMLSAASSNRAFATAAVFCVLFCLAIELIVWGRALFHMYLAKYGIAAMGTICGRRFKKSGAMNQYYVQYQFTALQKGRKGARLVKGECRVPWEYYTLAVDGERVVVTYDPSTPELNVLSSKALYRPV